MAIDWHANSPMDWKQTGLKNQPTDHVLFGRAGNDPSEVLVARHELLVKTEEVAESAIDAQFLTNEQPRIRLGRNFKFSKHNFISFEGNKESFIK